MHLHTGTQLQGGRYEIIRYISSGGFGCTYEAHNTRMNCNVAIKEFFVKDFCNRNKETNRITVATESKVELFGKLRKKFVEEAQSLYRMNHPNIVRVTDLFEENGTAYYVMDYIEGSSLATKIAEKGKLAESESLGYIRQVADALSYVHSQNRLHLDVKPQNIMIDQSGKAVLIDFGVSKQYDEVNGENTSTLLGSTPGYAPIEQGCHGLTEFHAATDIYALGATLYKALSGMTPVEAALRASGKKLQPLPANISPSTVTAIEKSMQLIIDNRPHSIEEFLLLLDSKDEKGKIRKEKEERKNDSEEMVLPGVMGRSEVTRIESGVSPYNSAFVNRAFVVDGVEFKMVAVEGGTFQMGATSEQQNTYDNERPVHSVTLSDYYIGETEVTQALWQAVMGSNPSNFTGNRQRPVESVSWNDCQTFISRLNDRTGMNFRLPTEAEWEYAARGGNRSNITQYSGSSNISNVAWYDSNGGSTTHPVKGKSPNELGLYDMSGNVYEWCNDWYSSDYYSNSPRNNPQGPSSGSYRVVRGGGLRSNARFCRVANRGGYSPDGRGVNFGLRLAL